MIGNDYKFNEIAGVLSNWAGLKRAQSFAILSYDIVDHITFHNYNVKNFEDVLKSAHDHKGSDRMLFMKPIYMF